MRGYPIIFALVALPFFAAGLYLTAGFCKWCAFPGILPFATFIGFGPGFQPAGRLRRLETAPAGQLNSLDRRNVPSTATAKSASRDGRP